MKSLTSRFCIHPYVYGLARGIIIDLNQKDEIGEVTLLHRFVRDKVRYVKDAYKVECVQYPWHTVRIGGDCDDKTLLLSCMLHCVGYKTRFVIVGEDRYQHIYPEVRLNGSWLAAETTEPWDLGEVRKKSKLRMVFDL